jgi:hypothetical protein
MSVRALIFLWSMILIYSGAALYTNVRTHCTCSHSYIFGYGIWLSYGLPLRKILSFACVFILILLIPLCLVSKTSMLPAESLWNMGQEAVRRFVRGNCMAVKLRRSIV